MLHGIGGFVSFLVIYWMISGAINSEARNQAKRIASKNKPYQEWL